MTAILDAPIHASPRALDEILALGRPTLVVFESPDCEHCRNLIPELASLARDFVQRALVVRVDAREGWLAARHHLTFVPTLLFCDRGSERFRVRGNPGALALRVHLTSLLSGIAPSETADGPRHTLAVGFGQPARSKPLRALFAR